MENATVSKAAGVWSGLICQDEVIARLKADSLAPETTANSYLFLGPPGSGRTVAAKAFAASLECETRVGCGECEQCKLVRAESHPDVVSLKASGLTISVAESRAAVAQSVMLPSKGRYKIVIVEDADRLTETAQNSLLKSFEEPPETTVWILSAPTKQDLLPTVVSRSRIINLHTPTTEAIAELLISEGVESSRANQAAKLSAGHIGIARHLAKSDTALTERLENSRLAVNIRTVGDAVLSAAKLIKRAEAATKDDMEARAAHEEKKLREELGGESGEIDPKLRMTFNRMVKDLKERIDKQAKRQQKDALHLALLDILTTYRDIALIQSGAGADSIINSAELEMLRKYAAALAPTELANRISKVQEAANNLVDTNANPQILLQALFAELLLPSRALN